jgi:hypothetical protein
MVLAEVFLNPVPKIIGAAELEPKEPNDLSAAAVPKLYKPPELLEPSLPL